MLSEKIQQMLGAIYNQFNEAEKFIKAAEKINQRVATAAINEIRYASRRLADFYALTVTGKKTSELETPEHVLFEVEQLCIRAKHDALDASLSFFSLFFGDLLERTSLEDICAICPNFLEVRRLQSEVDRTITVSREQRDQRQDLYREILDKHYPVLYTAFENLRHSETVINDAFLAKKRKELRDSALVIVSVVLGVVALILGILALPMVIRYLGE